MAPWRSTRQSSSSWLRISAATIDRLLSAAREQAFDGRKRRSGMGSAIRRSVPVRTFADWKDPPPGYFEADRVEPCGGTKQDGNFVHSLVLTDIASGWTECVALPVREQTLIVPGPSLPPSLPHVKRHQKLTPWRHVELTP